MSTIQELRGRIQNIKVNKTITDKNSAIVEAIKEYTLNPLSPRENNEMRDDVLYMLEVNPSIVEQDVIETLCKEEIITFQVLQDAQGLVRQIHDIETDKKIIDKDSMTARLVRLYMLTTPGSNVLSQYIIQDRKDDVLLLIADDPNMLGSDTMRLLVRWGSLTHYELNKIGIPYDFIELLNNERVKEDNEAPRPLECVERQSTEIYFWGIPSSGKSCAIGALLSMMNVSDYVRSMDPKPESQGYSYMNQLMERFRQGDIITLPPGTQVRSTYEIGFDLTDRYGRLHPITFIDLAGELIRCMYKMNAGKEKELTIEETAALKTLTNILVDNRSMNRKFHVFVLEYGGEQRKYEDYTQATYLGGALDYINKTGIFKDLTDHIYLLITKADKAKNEIEELNNEQEGGISEQDLFQNERKAIMNYIERVHGNKGFQRRLKNACLNNNINDGVLDALPFSLGAVCFKDYCRFNGYYANEVIADLVEKTWYIPAWQRKWWGAPLRFIHKIANK